MVLVIVVVVLLSIIKTPVTHQAASVVTTAAALAVPVVVCTTVLHTIKTMKVMVHLIQPTIVWTLSATVAAAVQQLLQHVLPVQMGSSKTMKETPQPCLVLQVAALVHLVAVAADMQVLQSAEAAAAMTAKDGHSIAR